MGLIYKFTCLIHTPLQVDCSSGRKLDVPTLHNEVGTSCEIHQVSSVWEIGGLPGFFVHFHTGCMAG